MQALMQPSRHRWTSMSREDQLKEAALAFIRLCAEQGEGDSPRQPPAATQVDPYTRASVASVARPTLPVMVRQRPADSSLQSDVTEDSRVSKRPVMKRKVLRRTPDGEVQVTDESVTSEPETNSPSDQEYGDLSQRMQLLNTREEDDEDQNQTHSSPKSEAACSWRATESPSWDSEREIQSQSTASFEEHLLLAAHPKSFILPRLEQLSRNKMKTDRVARYLEHKHDWECLRLPGEDPRKGVRWSIRAQMLYKSEFPPKAQRIYVPNNYLVPTEKKRSALRWGIRCDLANGVMPRNTYSS